MRVARRTARAILIDGNSRLILFRRTLPKRKPYWSTPGGGVDPEDGSIEAALHRELAEELGATVDRTAPVFLSTSPRGDGIAIAHFFVCRLVSMDLTKRTGSEFTNPAKGRYDVERIDLRGKKLARYALTPPEVKEFILANRQALLTTALAADTPPITAPPVDLDARPGPETAAGARTAAAARAAGPASGPAGSRTAEALTAAASQAEAGQPTTAQPETAQAEATSTDAARAEPARAEPARAEATRAAGARTGAGAAEAPAARTTGRPAGDHPRPADRAGDHGTPASGAPAAATPPRARRRVLPPILEIVDGEVVRDGSDGSSPDGPGLADPGDGLSRLRRIWRWGRP